jgi:hypothetical protein
MIFRQLFDPPSSTYTYLIGNERTGEAALVDPVREQVERDLRLVAKHLAAQGFSHVHNMVGGMLAWNAAALPIVRHRRGR